MNRKTIARTAASFVGLAMVLGVAAPAGAQTIAELQVQINALMAQLAALQGGSAPATGANFTMNLTVGSTGAEVTALQQMLVAQGHLTMPAGVAYGYFGPLTRSAVASWQAANGVAPAAGYFGPLSRAKANAMGGVVTPGTPTTPVAGITTPGVEGTLSVSLNPTPASGVKVYEGDSRVAALGIKLEAKTSDIRVERVKVQLPDVTFYNRIASRIYIMDGSTVLGSADLNSSTVIKEVNDYFITITGMNYVVPKDATRVITVALDIYPTVDSQWTDGDTFTLTIPTNGIRGVDGAGINQFGPTASSFARTITPTASLADSQTLAVSTSANTPVVAEVIAMEGTSENELAGLELLKFDLRATRANAKVTSAVVSFTRGGANAATSSVAYLYDGSALVGSASVVGTSATEMTATFSNIDFVVPADTTKTLTVKVDITGATSAATTFVASVAATTGIVAEKHDGLALAETGSALGQTITVRNVGPVLELLSKSLTPTTATGSTGATTTLTAKFTVKVTAKGGDIYLGTNATTSANRMFNETAFGIYLNSALATVASATSTDYVITSPASTVGLNEVAKLSENGSVTVDVYHIIPGRTAAGVKITDGNYSVGLRGVTWSADNVTFGTSNFMAGELPWRTTSQFVSH